MHTEDNGSGHIPFHAVIVGKVASSPADQRAAPTPTAARDALVEERRKLLQLYYGAKISEEQARLITDIDAMRSAEDAETAETDRAHEILDETIEAVEVHEDHLEVTVRGAPKLNVTLAEVACSAAVTFSCVGGGT